MRRKKACVVALAAPSTTANCCVLGALYMLLQRDKLTEENLKPKEQLTLEPYERDHAVVVGTYRGPKAGSGVV